MPFDMENRYMSKIPIILVDSRMYFIFNGVSFETNLFKNKKYTDLSFWMDIVIYTN